MNLQEVFNVITQTTLPLDNLTPFISQPNSVRKFYRNHCLTFDSYLADTARTVEYRPSKFKTGQPQISTSQNLQSHFDTGKKKRKEA